MHRVSTVKENLNYNRSGEFGYTDHDSYRDSFSGHERDHLFVNDGGRFVDVSGVSGADHPGDGRAFATLDFDRDGWTDFATMSANRPSFNLFRNEIGQLSEPGVAGNASIAVRLVGANRSASAKTGASNRDGIGARLRVGLGDGEIVLEHQAGEGMGAQNSATELIGIGQHAAASSLRVRWPSGSEQTSAEIPAGALVTVYEDPAQSPQGTAFVFEPYRLDGGPRVKVPAAGEALDTLPRFSLPSAAARAGDPDLRLYTATATWCPNCKKELAQLERVRAAFGTDEMAMFGVPVDDTETRAMFERYVAEHRPAYEMLSAISADEQAAMRDTLRSRLKSEGIPATLVTDAADRIVYVGWGVPDLSTLRRLQELVGTHREPADATARSARLVRPDDAAAPL